MSRIAIRPRLAGPGHRVAVIDDATASPPPHHEHGLARMGAAGIMRTSVKGVYYEWVRDLETKCTREKPAERSPAGRPDALTMAARARLIL